MRLFPQTFAANEQADLVKPTTPLIGRLADGSYRTSFAKEYPSGMNRSFAESFWRRIHHRFQVQGLPFCHEGFPAIAQELASISASVDRDRCMKPDYQPIWQPLDWHAWTLQARPKRPSKKIYWYPLIYQYLSVSINIYYQYLSVFVIVYHYLSVFIIIHPSLSLSLISISTDLIIYLSICLAGWLAVCRSIYLSIQLTKYLSIYPSVCKSVYVPDYVPVYLSIYLSVCLSICLSVYLSICLFIYLSVYLRIYQSIYMYVLFIYLYMYICST